jgi:hypothetical protein
MVGRFLIDGLPIISDDLDITRREPKFSHQATSAFCVNRAHCVVQPAQFENREFVFKGAEYVASDGCRPIVAASRFERRPDRQAVTADFDINQDCVNAIEGGSTVESNRRDHKS